jgi:hypothetical protein
VTTPTGQGTDFDHQYPGPKIRCTDQIIREGTEIKLHPNNMNCEDRLSLTTLWKPLNYPIKEIRHQVWSNNISNHTIKGQLNKKKKETRLAMYI